MVNISDVARAAGVSPSTVSRVLNQPDIVTPDKRDRVLAAIARLNYQPSTFARGLRRGTFETLALLVGDIAQPFHGRLAKAVELAAEEKGYSVLLCDLDHRQDRLVGFLRSLPKRGIDGILIATADNLDVPAVHEALTAFLAQDIAAVTTSQHLQSVPVPAVVVDRTAAAHDATRHLLDLGRWPVAFLGGGASAYSQRLADGYRAGCRDAGHRTQPRLMLDGGFQTEPAMRAVAALLAEGTIPEGIVAANVPMALGALRALAERDLDVPDDVAIIVCEDVPVAAYMRPSLTCVSTDLDAYGRRAVDTLLAAVAGHDVPRVTVLPHTLILRDSAPAAVPPPGS
ncbi:MULTISPECIES: LacI family DNA-binding transcriptional regulator [Streptomyces]|uniref:LacI family transcriptional regulator n=1 Tax=Streptomyces acidicola TaxID=2596892 RepID=A0A5N8WUZ1_9ACTN|nr:MULTISPECIES: LacI family DNA-binding transcriptional regulator [Streptomyces]MBA2810209.1 LacI family DNA-binding transcriptional regulator [Streptomyces sp. KM273126]MPY50464.1 LacI family transcriptional regulator [Streptomyces acidicola]